MGLRDMVFGRLLKVNAEHFHSPSDEARDVQRRQKELEWKLRERQLRRDIIRSQVEGLRGG